MKKRVINIILIISLFVLALTTTVSALSFTATMKPSSTTVPEQTEFAVTVKVSNLDVGSNGINSLTGYLKYDKDIFETISESSIEGLNSWSATYDESTGKISLTKSSFVTSTQEVFQITFKTKSDVSGKSGAISYTNIVASNSEATISATDISTSITVGTESSSGNSDDDSSNTIVISNNTTNTNTNTNQVSNNSITVNSVNKTNNTNNTSNVSNFTNNNSVSGVVNNTNTSSDQDMPYTGIDDTLLKIIFVVIAVAIVFYIKFEKINKDLK